MKGSPVSLKLDEIIAGWKELCEAQKDAHVAISADEGDGKTHFMYNIVINKLRGDPWKNIIYTENPKEFNDKYEELEHGMGMGFDEALNILGRLDWHRIQTRNMVNKFRADVRKEKNAIWIYNIQLFRELHTYWRTHRIHFWLEIAPRQWFKDSTFAFYMERQRVPFLTGKRDTWLLDEEEKRWMERMRGGAIIGEAYLQMLRTHPFYKGEMRISRLDEKDEREYAKRRLEAKEVYKTEDDAASIKPSIRADKSSKRLARAMIALGDTGLTEPQIAKLLNMTPGSLDRILRWHRSGAMQCAPPVESAT